MQAAGHESQILKDVGAIPEHLKELSLKTERLKARLRELKEALPEFSEGTSRNTSQLNVESIRADLRKARDTLQLFKSLIAGEQPQNGAGAGVGSGVSVPVVVSMRSEDDRSKPLIERIGGEIVLEAIVDAVYSRFLNDVRLRAFFEKSAKKIATIKRRLYEFLLGYTGGKVTYDESNLKPVHYHLNITNYHFDAVLDNFEQVMLNEIHVHPAATRDFIATISRIRTEITTGYTIRSEIARLGSADPELLFKRMGDLDGMIRFIDKLYEIIAKDSRIRNFFVGSSFEKIKHGQRVYITELLGGPKIYKGRTMEEIHANLGINDYHFDCWLQDVDKALNFLNMDDSVIDQVIVQLESVRSAVIGVEAKKRKFKQQSLRMEHFDSVVASVDQSQPTDTTPEGLQPSLLTLLGGEQNVESLVELVYHACISDPRLLYFFPASKARSEVFKRGVTNAIITVSGGPVLYDMTNLRNVHQKMNITDFHFDTFMSIIESCACSVMGIQPDVAKELVARLSMLRSDITAGCTVRYELAKQRSETNSGVGSLMGTPDGIRRVIDQLYRLVRSDPRINIFFQGARIDFIIESQSKFLCQLFGGYDVYLGPEIRKVHSRLNVSDYHFEVFLENMSKAVRQCGYSPETADECIVILNDCRLQVVNPSTRLTAAAQSSAGSRTRLYDAFGGESGLAKLASCVIDSSREIPTLRKFFELNQSKIISQKKNLGKFYQAITANGGILSEGVREQWEARLCAVHSLLNIPDGHIDIELNVFRDCIHSLYPDVKSEYVGEFIDLVARFRSSISHGYRVRKEFASERQRTGTQQRLFRSIGGEEGVETIVDKWIQLIRNDIRIWHQYERRIDEFRDVHVRSLTELVQGCVDSHVLQEMRDLHAKFGTSDYTFDVLVGDLEKAMVDLRFHQDIVNDMVVVILGCVRPMVVFGGGAVISSLASSKFRNGESLYDRIGENEMEPWIDCSIERVVVNDKIRSFFDIPKSRLRAFKRKLVRFLSSEFGGPAIGSRTNQDISSFATNISYGTESVGSCMGLLSPRSDETPVPGEERYLRNVHSKFNITDQIFDEFVTCLLSGARDCGFEERIVTDMVTVLNALRYEVVIGWTVRSYKAADRIRENPVTIYERLGGTSNDPGLERFIGRLFELAERDKRIGEFFIGSRSAVIRKTQGDYIASVLGGPVSRSRPLDDVHRIYCISSHHFDCFLHNVMNAARDCGANTELVDEIIVTIEPFRDTITTGTSPDNFEQMMNPADLRTK